MKTTAGYEKKAPFLLIFALIIFLWTVATVIVLREEMSDSRQFLDIRVRGAIPAEVRAQIDQSSSRHVLLIVLVWLVGCAGLCLALNRIRKFSRALQESEESYRQQFQQNQTVMLIIDPNNGAIVEANPAACLFYGYDYAKLQASSIFDINVTDPKVIRQCILNILDGSARQFQFVHRRADGTLRNVEVSCSPVLINGKQLLHSIIFDISDRIAAEQELRSKMDFAENLVHNSTTPTFVIDSDHRVLIWNRALEVLSGIEAREVLGTDTQWRPFYPNPRPCLADIALNGSMKEASGLYSHIARSRLIPDGLRAEGDFIIGNRNCRLVFSAAPIRDLDNRTVAAIETMEDITERISLESQLLHAQKMESVGMLAGGIAHDFNNILSVISGYVYLLQLSQKDDKHTLHIADEILASVERAADMTRSLLAFSGKYELQMQLDDLNQIIDSIRKSLTRLIREDITLTVRTGDELLPVYVDRVQIDQVLINLVINARDALETGGLITVSTRSLCLEEALIAGNVVIPPGHYACLLVADNGAGIPQEAIKRIFEPFFTTKEKGKGTGLGLSIAQSIITRHNGFITVKSSAENGTEFHIFLPFYAGELSRKPLEAIENINHYGTETILIAEDDQDIMAMHREILGCYGYTVVVAFNGIEALERFEAGSGQIRIAIIDVIMPRMNGREVVEALRLKQPDLPIIMTSGYTDELIDSSMISNLKVHYLQKPVRPLDLLAAIRNSLDKQS